MTVLQLSAEGLQRLDVLLQTQHFKAQCVVLFAQRLLCLSQPLLFFLCLLQLIAQRLQAGGDLFDQIIGAAGGAFELLELCLHLKVFPMAFLAQAQRLLIAHLHPLVLGGIGDLILLTACQLRLHAVQLCAQLCQLLLCCLQSRALAVHLLFERLNLLLQRADFLPAGEQSSGFGCRTAGHRTARIDQLTVQGNHPEFIGIFFGNRNRCVDVLRHRYPAQQVLHDGAVARLTLCKVACASNKTFHLLDARRCQLLRCDDRQRQEGRPARPRILQMADGVFCALLVLGD